MIFFIKRKIKALKLFGPKTWCTKEPFGYLVAYIEHILMSCSGQYFIVNTLNEVFNTF